MDLLDLGRECVWCDWKQRWVHKQICRWKAFSLGGKKVLQMLPALTVAHTEAFRKKPEEGQS